MVDRTAQAVIALIAEELEIPEAKLDANSSVDTVPEWDSMAHLNICLAFQDRFDVKLDLEAIAAATSVPALVALLD
jgi:acyl carrier protein